MRIDQLFCQGCGKSSSPDIQWIIWRNLRFHSTDCQKKLETINPEINLVKPILSTKEKDDLLKSSYVRQIFPTKQLVKFPKVFKVEKLPEIPYVAESMPSEPFKQDSQDPVSQPKPNEVLLDHSAFALLRTVQKVVKGAQLRGHEFHHKISMETEDGKIKSITVVLVPN